MRSLARETVLKYLYAQLFNPGDEELFAVLIKNAELNKEDTAFAHDLYNLIHDNYNDYLNKIEDLSIGFKLDRVRPTDKCAILIGMAELKNYLDTPIPVVIDEAVKLAFKYSTEKSTDFVNGILASYSKEVRNG